MKVKIATAQYQATRLESRKEFESKLSLWVQEACEQDAELLVFPEYAGMELVSLLEEGQQASLDQQLLGLQDLLPWYEDCYRQLAIKHQVTIVAGTIPVLEENSYFNRAYVYYANGDYSYQDKLKMTRFEKEQWAVSGTTVQVLFKHNGISFGIAICYDAEFPLLVRELVKKGALCILVPSCTDRVAGYQRVKISCQARAIENQCYVVQSALVGEAGWSDAIDTNFGAAAVYTPADFGFPDDGVLAVGALNQAQWLYAELDMERVKKVRNWGQVLNHRDW